jgi:nicotinamidase-related amidase
MKLSPPGPKDTLLVVGVQNDFLPGGALAVGRGDEVPQSATVVSKAATADADSYFAFGGTDLAPQLRDRAVDVAPGDGGRAIAKMEQAGAHLVPA